ncbi:hypothetical protein K457DRAFT_419566 [Linnemannia elongata AG-77]|uniref:Uncharacterized protein n=1 Tax=Linnemannia elongata AG-77 TaxID=1314771 RepID=A0A197JZC4_9FUNG|nr:hypothetical protein K457DRAFT_419566 [Linnemannia elongata AG-77]
MRKKEIRKEEEGAGKIYKRERERERSYKNKAKSGQGKGKKKRKGKVELVVVNGRGVVCLFRSVGLSVGHLAGCSRDDRARPKSKDKQRNKECKKTDRCGDG